MNESVRVAAGRQAGIAHLVSRFALEHVTFAAPQTLCRRARPYQERHGWYGWKDVAEIETAKRLPLCKVCEKADAKNKPVDLVAALRASIEAAKSRRPSPTP